LGSGATNSRPIPVARLQAPVAFVTATFFCGQVVRKRGQQKRKCDPEAAGLGSFEVVKVIGESEMQ
jgi:hypothetical protein